ncbi:ABC transporter permease [Streptomyces sp. B6B3]|uniref:ABC transporter permease n=1 Tax=Streptomyces sp. B6B3 TaxID=3153570 RepID=UPI00325E7CE0
MSVSSPPTARQAPPSPRAFLAVLVLVPAFVALVLWAFTWPAARTAPHELPLGVAGPSEAAGPIAERLAQRGDAFEVHRYPDAAAARAGIEDREVYGAVVAAERPGQAPELLVASAGGPTVAALLEQLAAEMAEETAPGGPGVRVTDVVPTPAADPRGAVFNSSVLPLALAGIAIGAAATVTGLAATRRVHGLATLVGAAALVGLVSAAIGHSWLGALDGDWWTVAGALGLVVLASAATVAGCAALLGLPGIGLGALLVMLLGNPWSGVSSAPEMLPDPVGVLGQWLPLGAGATLLRSVAFFDGAAAGFPLLVLVGWTVLGGTAIALGGRRRRAGASPPSGPGGPGGTPTPDNGGAAEGIPWPRRAAEASDGGAGQSALA